MHVCRLLASQQTWPKRSLPPAQDRPDNRLHRGMRPPLIPRRILRIQPNKDEGGRRRTHVVHHSLRRFLLHDDAFRTEEHGCHIPTYDASMLEGSDRTKCPSLRRQHSSKTYQANTLLEDPRKTFAALNHFKREAWKEKCSIF